MKGYAFKGHERRGDDVVALFEHLPAVNPGEEKTEDTAIAKIFLTKAQCEEKFNALPYLDGAELWLALEGWPQEVKFLTKQP